MAEILHPSKLRRGMEVVFVEGGREFPGVVSDFRKDGRLVIFDLAFPVHFVDRPLYTDDESISKEDLLPQSFALAQQAYRRMQRDNLLPSGQWRPGAHGFDKFVLDEPIPVSRVEAQCRDNDMEPWTCWLQAATLRRVHIDLEFAKNALEEGLVVFMAETPGVKEWRPTVGAAAPIDDRARFGLTEKGIRLYFMMRAVFQEFARWREEVAPGGEPLIETTEAALEAMSRRWDGLWVAQSGLSKDIPRVEALTELALRPRTIKELSRRVFRKARVAPGDVRRAVEELMAAGLVTTDLGQVYVE